MHDHEFYVFDTSVDDDRSVLLVVCLCGFFGNVSNPSEQEWEAALQAQSKPYPWLERSRVTFRYYFTLGEAERVRYGDAGGE